MRSNVFSDVLGLDRVVRRLVAEDGFPSNQIALASITEYEQFFLLMASNPGQRLTPSLAVDLVWQRHLLDTKAYMVDCKKWAGGYIHREAGGDLDGFKRCVDKLDWNSQSWGFQPAEVHGFGGERAEFIWDAKSLSSQLTNLENLSWLIDKTRLVLQKRDSKSLWVQDALVLLEANPTVALEEYRRFLTLMMHQDRLVTPPKLVDELWHQHILKSRSYFAFCNQVAGRYLHHTPSYEKTHEFHRPNYLKTQVIYSEHFATTPTPEIWLHMGESGSCSSEPASPYYVDKTSKMEIHLKPGIDIGEHRNKLFNELHPVLQVKGLTLKQWTDFLTEVMAVPFLPPPSWVESEKTSTFRSRNHFAILFPIAIATFICLGIITDLPKVLSNVNDLIFYLILLICLASLCVGLVYWYLCIVSLIPTIYQFATPKIIEKDTLLKLVSKYQAEFGNFGITVQLDSTDTLFSNVVNTIKVRAENNNI